MTALHIQLCSYYQQCELGYASMQETNVTPFTSILHFTFYIFTFQVFDLFIKIAVLSLSVSSVKINI